VIGSYRLVQIKSLRPGHLGVASCQVMLRQDVLRGSRAAPNDGVITGQGPRMADPLSDARSSYPCRSIYVLSSSHTWLNTSMPR